MFPTVTMYTQLRTLRTGSYAPDKMIVVPRPVVNDVTATSLCQSYYENEKVYPEHSRRLNF